MDTSKADAPKLIDWSEAIDGRDGISEHVFALQHLLHYLMIDLEGHFDQRRARSVEPGGSIDFTFQQDGINATLWLCGRAWSTAKTLTETLEGLQRLMDVERGAR